MYEGTLKLPSAAPAANVRLLSQSSYAIFKKVEIDGTSWWFGYDNRPGGVTLKTTPPNDILCNFCIVC